MERRCVLVPCWEIPDPDYCFQCGYWLTHCYIMNLEKVRELQQNAEQVRTGGKVGSLMLLLHLTPMVHDAHIIYIV